MNNELHFNPNLSFNATPIEDLEAKDTLEGNQLYSIIPTELLADPTIAPLSVRLYGAVNALSWKLGLCKASNAAFAKHFPWASAHVVGAQLNKLIEKRWVFRQLFNRPGSCRRYLVTKCYYPRYQRFLLTQGKHEVAAQLEAFFGDVTLNQALEIFKEKQEKQLAKKNKKAKNV